MRLEDVTPGGDHARFQYVNCGDTVPPARLCILHRAISYLLYNKEQDRLSVMCCYLARLVAAGLIHCAATLTTSSKMLHHDTDFEK